MSGRHTFFSFQAPGIAVNAAMSGNLASTAIDIRYVDNLAVQFNFTGSPSGTFFINGSIDGVNWAPIAITPSLTTSSSPALANLNFLGFAYIQPGYTFTSGSGTLVSVLVSGKMV